MWPILDPGPSQTVLGEIDQCTPSGTSWQKLKAWSGFANGAHVLRIEAVDYLCLDNDEHSYFSVDAFWGFSQDRSYVLDDDNRLTRQASPRPATASAR